MILYHFTAAEYLDAILREGLSKGDVPLVPVGAGLTGVWLTTDVDPAGQGLTDGYVLSEQERAVWSNLFHRPCPPGMRFPNKRAVRIKVDIPREDTKLVRWTVCGREHLEPSWYRDLSRAAGGSRKTSSHWLYFGVIPPERFLSVERRHAERSQNELPKFGYHLGTKNSKATLPR